MYMTPLSRNTRPAPRPTPMDQGFAPWLLASGSRKQSDHDHAGVEPRPAPPASRAGLDEAGPSPSKGSPMKITALIASVFAAFALTACHKAGTDTQPTPTTSESSPSTSPSASSVPAPAPSPSGTAAPDTSTAPGMTGAAPGSSSSMPDTSGATGNGSAGTGTSGTGLPADSGTGNSSGTTSNTNPGGTGGNASTKP